MKKTPDHFEWKLEGLFYNSIRIVILMVMVSFDREVIMTSCFLSISMTDNKTGVIHQIFMGDKTLT